MAKQVQVYFSGWFEVDENTKFDHILLSSKKEKEITAKEYMELTEEERKNYVLSFDKGWKETTDGALDEFDVDVINVDDEAIY